jgi:hypothetical protein
VFIENQRQISFNKIDGLYDKMELLVIRNNITPDNELISYLRAHKIFKIHNELTDIQVLVPVIVALQMQNKKQAQQIEKRKKYIESLPVELRDISSEFNKEIARAIKFSMFKPSFIPKMVKYSMLYFVATSYKSVANVVAGVKELINSPNISLMIDPQLSVH